MKPSDGLYMGGVSVSRRFNIFKGMKKRGKRVALPALCLAVGLLLASCASHKQEGTAASSDVASSIESSMERQKHAGDPLPAEAEPNKEVYKRYIGNVLAGNDTAAYADQLRNAGIQGDSVRDLRDSFKGHGSVSDIAYNFYNKHDVREDKIERTTIGGILTFSDNKKFNFKTDEALQDGQWRIYGNMLDAVKP